VRLQSMQVSAYDLAVIGGGVIGLACAWRLAQDGAAVAVIDPAPGQGASYAAAGMLAPVTEIHSGEEAVLRLGLEAAERYPAFVAELEQSSGSAVGYRACGTLTVALDAGDSAVLDDVADLQRRLGLRVQALTGREGRRLEPLLAPGIRSAALVEGDHQVDGRCLTAALQVAAERAGAVVVRRSAAAVTTRADRVTGVRLDDGTELATGAVVLAAGARCGDLDGVPGEALPPVRPVKGQVLRLRVPPAYRPFLSRTVRGTVRGFPVYLVPREDGELVVGATQEEQGYDETVTAGAVYQLLRDAHALVPALTELPLVESTARLRPGSPDNAPVVGPTALDGLVAATGHHRNGILLADVTARAVAALVRDGVLPPEMAPFAAHRFQTRAMTEGALR
jgi:glycine oxidase